MPSQKHTKESIIQTLQNLARRVDRKKLRIEDVTKVLSYSTLCGHFGNLGNALEAAGLERTKMGAMGGYNRLPDDVLLQSLLSLENKLGREPRFTDYRVQGKYSDSTLTSRFGKWKDVLEHYRKWKAEKPAREIDRYESSKRLEEQIEILEPLGKESVKTSVTVSHEVPEQLYGEPIDFRGLRHAPVNEQGVVYLFGMVSRELGFYVEALQQGFPDCEAKYLYDRKKNFWAKARIEFEYKASTFKEHGHDPSQCDFIVCWINDWLESPINVIELKTEILKLSSK